MRHVIRSSFTGKVVLITLYTASQPATAIYTAKCLQSGLGSLRNMLLIECKPDIHDAHETLYVHVFKMLKALAGFHTVVIDVAPRSDFATRRASWGEI